MQPPRFAFMIGSETPLSTRIVTRTVILLSPLWWVAKHPNILLPPLLWVAVHPFIFQPQEISSGKYFSPISVACFSNHMDS